MGRIDLPGRPDIAVTIRRSARARRLSLRLSSLDGRVTLTLPAGVAEADGLAFVHSKERWLRKHLAAQAPAASIRFGTELPVEGRPRLLVEARTWALSDTALHLPGPEATLPARLRGWLRGRARDRLAPACDRYAAALGRPYSRLTLRDTRSRWGSCTAEGGLMFSWRLIMAPAEVLDYVAAHEVAHLAEMNHSPRFWAVVARLYGDWQPQRDWLRRHGGDLHRYRFDD